MSVAILATMTVGMRMRNYRLTWCLAVFVFTSLGAEPDRVLQLQEQLRQLKEQFARTQQEQLRMIETLQRQIDSLSTNRTEAPPPPRLDANSAANPASPPDGAAPTAVEKTAWKPSDPIRIGTARSYVDIGLVGTFAVGGSTASDVEGGTQLGGHDPNQRGFTVQGLEASLSGAVDPYFRAQANLAFTLDSQGESAVELEEAYMETLSLPGNLQFRGGQFLTEFGRHNVQHPHAWGFVDAPLISGRVFGPDGLRNPGARLAWLMPIPFYSDLTFGVQDSQGETAHSFRSDHGDELFFGRPFSEGRVSGAEDLLYTARYAVSADLSPTHTLLAGISGAWGPNGSGTGSRTEVYGADVVWKWKSARHSQGFPFLAWQTEGILRRLEASAFSWDLNNDGLLSPQEGERDADGDGVADSVPSESLWDYGFYSQLLWGFRRGWVAGLRYDRAWGQDAGYEERYGKDPDRAQRWRLSPNLTWYPSEFSKLRLQYNYDDREQVGVDHSVWLQFEFSLGAHAAHKF